MLLLMTMPIDDSAWKDACEYLRLKRGEELKKLKKRLSEEESRQQVVKAMEFAAGDSPGSQQRGEASGEATGAPSLPGRRRLRRLLQLLLLPAGAARQREGARSRAEWEQGEEEPGEEEGLLCMWA